MQIRYFRPEEYDKPFFTTGLEVLQGATFPLVEKAFQKTAKPKISPYWKKVLSATGLEPSNLSYPKQPKQEE